MMLQTDALTRRFGTFTAVDALTLSVDAGEVFGLLGANGAGKSTAIKMLTTLLPPTSGTAAIAGLDVVRQAAAVRRIIGYVPQMVSADGSLTGYENLLVFARLYAIPKGEREERIRQSLAFMGLEDAAGKLVQTFSGGMLRRLEIAISTLHRPRLLFLDEPTVGLDPLAREAVWAHIVQLQSNYGTTVFLTTHYMEEADRLCRRIGILHRGKMAAIGTPLELKRSVGDAQTTLDEVFAHYAGGALESEEGYREAARTRQTARRMG
jgi:ABC-2 type transport system ATP-binding protein